MNPKEYRTPQDFVNRQHPKFSGGFLVGLDAGYSSMKVFAEDKYFYFPTFAKKMGEDMLGIIQEQSIIYEDLETGDQYMLGYVAQNMVNEDDTSDTEGEWYSRKRYSNKKFRILCNAALAIATENKAENEDIVIQTGLPTDYMGDKANLVAALCKPSKFRICIGFGEWKTFENGIQVKPENVYVMPQPAGSLYSVMINKQGEMIADFMGKTNTLVMDVGFGTFDFFGVKKGRLDCKASITNVGMKAVLDETSHHIRDELGEDIHVSAMQSILEKGTVQCMNDDDDELRSEDRPIAELLERASREVFEDAFEKARATTNNFRGYNNIVIAGGTGRAWYDWFKEKMKGLSNVNVFACNRNDELPFILGNVRGYYMYRYRTGK